MSEKPTPGEQLAEDIWQQLQALIPEERARFISIIEGEWCDTCGNTHPGYPCQCQNEEKT
jgi:hypothetical protein